MSSVVTAFLMELMSEKWVPFRTDLILGKRKKSHGARLGEPELSKSGSASRRSVLSWQTVNLCCLWYSERILGTIFTHNLPIFEFSVRIFHPHCVSAKAPHKSFLQLVDNLHTLVVSHDRCCYQSCLSPACRSLIVLTFFSTLSESFVPIKSTSSRHCFFFVNLL